MSFNVLVSSAGRRVALLEIFRQTLDELGVDGLVCATDMGRLSSAFHRADRAFNVPRATHPDFIPAMLSLCSEHSIRLVVPTIDTELPALAEARERFAAIGTSVLVSDPEVVEIGADKFRTHEWLQRSGLPTVRSASLAEVLADPDAWTWPLITKPRRGSSSEGVAVVDSPQALQVAADDSFIVQSLAPGQEYTVSCLVNDEGRCVCAVPRQRLETRAGEVSKGRTVRARVLQDLAARACEALPGARGVLNVQIFWDRKTDRCEIIEVNARFGGGYPLAWEAGAHYPRWILEELLGLPSTSRPDDWQDGLVMLRYDAAVFVDTTEAGLDP